MWKVRSLCPCGWYDTPTSGSEFFSKCHYPICPECGLPHYERGLVSGKLVEEPKLKWWHRSKYKLVVK